MKTIQLAGGGAMPVLGLGTWNLTGEACESAVRLGLELGYRHIDTAEAYANEPAIARGLADSGVDRIEVFLTSKVWTNHFTAADVPRAAERALRLLKTDYLDLLLMHWPNPEVPLAETLGALAALVEEGKVRAIGVSNFRTEVLREALAASPVPIACDQVRYHVGVDQEELRQFAREKGVAITAYSPLCQRGILEDPLLVEVARHHGKSTAQVALRWLLDREGVAAIPKASQEAHLKENLDVFDFALSAEERSRLDAWAPPA